MENSIMEDINNKLAVPSSFKLKPTGLEIIGEPSWEEWVDCGRFIQRSRESVHFWIGDWLLYGEGRWGEKYNAAQELTGFDYQTLRIDKVVAYAIPPEKRKKELTFSHYELIAKFDEEEQDEYIKAAIQNKFSVRALDSYIKSKEDVFKKNTNDLFPRGNKDVSSVSPESLRQEEGNLLTVKKVLELNDVLLASLDEINFTTLSEKVRKELLKRLQVTSRRIDGFHMEYEDENE